MHRLPLPAQELKTALNAADLRILIMCLYQITGDPKWISDAFKPIRDNNIVAHPDAGLTPDQRADILKAAESILTDPQQNIRMDVPDTDLLATLLNHCIGEHVAPEYAPMMREQMGFQDLWAEIESTPKDAAAPKVIIAGCGISGLLMGYTLKKYGVDFTIFEKNPDLGGTWFENKYPGCGVDTPNHSYSFSFTDPYPWSRYFSPRDEIFDYIKRSAEQFDISDHIQFNTKIMQAEWCEASRKWQISTQGADHNTSITKADIFISAVGQLNTPSIPDISGLSNFKGTAFHTARWPENIDLNHKKVAIIGTGASAMQIVPEIADHVSQLDIYQRQAQWARPIKGYHEPISADQQWLIDNVPFYLQWFRFTFIWRYGDGLLPTIHRAADWDKQDSVSPANDRHRQQMTRFIEEKLSDRPDLMEKCIPNYPPYGKRILLENNWYETLKKPNVNLISTGITHIGEDHIVTQDGKHQPCDILVLSTGFQVTHIVSHLNIIGRDGQNLKDVWQQDNPKAYIGFNVPGFPNFFMLLGPGTSLGHGGSAIFQAECQVKYIMNAIQHMRKNNITSLDIKPEAYTDYVAKHDAAHNELIWTHPQLDTYYRNRHNRVFSVMPWRLVDFWHMTHQFDPKPYIAA